MEENIETELEPEEPGEGQKAASSSPRIWVTLVVAIATLVVGVALGYFGRGVMGPEALAAKGTATAAAGAVQTRAASNKEVMDLVIQQTRHFRGDKSAPVTLIEFSDFQ